MPTFCTRRMIRRHPKVAKRIRNLGLRVSRGDATESAGIARALLDGEPGPRRDVVLLNAGAALEVAGHAPNLEAGISAAGEAIDSGAAARTLQRWLAVSNA